MNPYASYLGEKAPLSVIAETPQRLQSLLTKIGVDRSGQSPAPGKWSAREILCHLADCELVFAFRLRQTLAEPHHVIQPFDQDDWAKMYGAYDAPTALAVFSSTRKWNLALIRAVPDADYSKPVTHPERGAMTFGVVVETMAGHDINHIRQIEAIAQ
jgi:uncharacterized damage-inducible protein DinB